jgi:hypothetical protein
MGLGKLWARVVGLKGWNKEVEQLHNIEGDETPPTGASPSTVVGDRRPAETNPENPKRKYEDWPGKDPGH